MGWASTALEAEVMPSAPSLLVLAGTRVPGRSKKQHLRLQHGVDGHTRCFEHRSEAPVDGPEEILTWEP